MSLYINDVSTAYFSVIFCTIIFNFFAKWKIPTFFNLFFEIIDKDSVACYYLYHSIYLFLFFP